MNRQNKMICVVRTDLKMNSGKIAAQVAHGVLNISLKNNLFLSNVFQEWINEDYTKIVVGIDSEKELLELETKANELLIPNYLVQDKGYTCFNGILTNTVLILGPECVEKINSLTKTLKLLR